MTPERVRRPTFSSVTDRLSTSEAQTERLAFALWRLAAELVEERCRTSALRGENVELRARLEAPDRGPMRLSGRSPSQGARSDVPIARGLA